MKKIFLSLFLVGALTFGLQSCAEDDPCDDVTCGSGQICDNGTCVADPASCDICGTYNGSLTGNVSVQDTSNIGTQEYIIDTIFTSTQPLSSISTVAQSGNNYTLEIDLSALGIAGLKPRVTGSYNASTKVITFTDAEYSYNLGGSANLDFIVNGTADLSTPNNINANVTLESPSEAVAVTSGTLVITGTK